MALNAKVVLASIHGERSLPLEALYTGYRQNVMAKDELVTRIDIPCPSRAAPPNTCVPTRSASARTMTFPPSAW